MLLLRSSAPITIFCCEADEFSEALSGRSLVFRADDVNSIIMGTWRFGFSGGDRSPRADICFVSLKETSERINEWHDSYQFHVLI